ncbi:MAG TPA: glycerol-3-phosphate dehydrogenase/oxidase [Bryobacteraceae bacterium]|jgi:glycerol-3-phosphate dehydrogenase
MMRGDVLRKIGSTSQWDVVVVGGGATGLGTALEAATRGHRTLLLEAEDFAKGTSSRSTKLVHGGVRYLQQGNVKLVLEALRERGRMLRNAPHLAHRRAFVIPAYAYWELPFYGVGLTMYDLLAGKERLGRSRVLSKRAVEAALPTVDRKGLRGGILYYDGQFDDARFAITLLRTFLDEGGTALNYARVIGLLKNNGTVSGVVAEDREIGERFDCPAKTVVNATGIFSDELRQMDSPDAKKILAVSQGSHIVLPRDYLPNDSALMVPRTSDGRVLFAIPWHDRVVVGTTDDPVPQPEYEPLAMPDERAFLLEHLERYLGRRPAPGDIRSVWSGQRPLVRQADASNTAAISRDHTILISPSKLITITGGKWTTYRKMAEDVIDRIGGSPSRTANLRLHGWTEESVGDNAWLRVYGSDAPQVRALSQELLHPSLPFSHGEVRWAARQEMARTVEDVLARRTRALFLDARASLEAAPIVARVLAEELGYDSAWEQAQLDQFRSIASGYIWPG